VAVSPALPSEIVVLGALLGVVAGVLAVGGMAKLRAPDATTPMLAALGLPARTLVARLLGAVEVGIGAATFLLGGRVLAALTALLFVGFTVSILRLRARGDASVSCGCFGRSSAPPSTIHVAVDTAAALVAAAAAAVAAPGFVDLRSELPAGGASYVLVAVVAVGLMVAVLTALPEALDAARRRPASETARLRPVQAFRVEASG